APDGQARRELPIRARHGQPGSYTADILLSQPGVYTLRIWGYIFDVAFEEEFQTHEVTPLAEVRLPQGCCRGRCQHGGFALDSRSGHGLRRCDRVGRSSAGVGTRVS